MSREDRYADSCAIAMDKMANDIKNRLEREVGFEWDESPDLTDLWRMYKFMADLEEAHGKMIHGNIATRKGIPDLVGEAATAFMDDNAREILDELTEINNKFKEMTETWCQLKWRVGEITNQLHLRQREKDEDEIRGRMEEAARKKEVARLKKAANLWLQ